MDDFGVPLFPYTSNIYISIYIFIYIQNISKIFPNRDSRPRILPLMSTIHQIQFLFGVAMNHHFFCWSILRDQVHSKFLTKPRSWRVNPNFGLVKRGNTHICWLIHYLVGGCNPSETYDSWDDYPQYLEK